MRKITLGNTGIEAIQNGFGCLPIQRVSFQEAADLLLKAYHSGVTFFDTARAYSDSEEKIGEAFKDLDRSTYILASKTAATTPEGFYKDLETSLKNLKTDYIDIYQLHMVDMCYRPNDGTGMYECLLDAKEKGLIKHIGITTHKCEVAKEIAVSGLYETLQYPFSYLNGDIELEIYELCKKNKVGFIAMKALAGGLLTNTDACMAYMSKFDVMPIWGIQRMSELDAWLSYNTKEIVLSNDLKEAIEKDKKELSLDFCRGCGYCYPCSVGIEIRNAARMIQMIRRSPSDSWLSPSWQKEMNKINDCMDCGLCQSRCPYGLNIPVLLRKNLEDYNKIVSGEIKV